MAQNLKHRFLGMDARHSQSEKSQNIYGARYSMANTTSCR
jgi:hypothetical protein